MKQAQGSEMGDRIPSSLGVFSSLVPGLQTGVEDVSEMLRGESSLRRETGNHLGFRSSPVDSCSSHLFLEEMAKSS